MMVTSTMTATECPLRSPRAISCPSHSSSLIITHTRTRSLIYKSTYVRSRPLSKEGKTLAWNRYNSSRDSRIVYFAHVNSRSLLPTRRKWRTSCYLVRTWNILIEELDPLRFLINEGILESIYKSVLFKVSSARLAACIDLFAYTTNDIKIIEVSISASKGTDLVLDTLALYNKFLCLLT